MRDAWIALAAERHDSRILPGALVFHFRTLPAKQNAMILEFCTWALVFHFTTLPASGTSDLTGWFLVLDFNILPASGTSDLTRQCHARQTIQCGWRGLKLSVCVSHLKTLVF